MQASEDWGIWKKGHPFPERALPPWERHGERGTGKRDFSTEKKKNGIGSWQSSKQGHIQGERVLGVGFGDRKEATHLDQPLQGFSEGITNTGPLLEF